jgi:hypothetical protein
LETIPESSVWETYKPRERVVTYYVAGYAESFHRPYLFEVWTEINSHGNGLIYSAEQRSGFQLFWLGEDKFWPRATRGEDPYASNRLHIHGECAPTFNDGGMPTSLREVVLSLTSLIKLEAKFNDQKVGSNVTVAVLDRVGKAWSGFAL